MDFLCEHRRALALIVKFKVIFFSRYPIGPDDGLTNLKRLHCGGCVGCISFDLCNFPRANVIPGPPTKIEPHPAATPFTGLRFLRNQINQALVLGTYPIACLRVCFSRRYQRIVQIEKYCCYWRFCWGYTIHIIVVI